MGTSLALHIYTSQRTRAPPSPRTTTVHTHDGLLGTGDLVRGRNNHLRAADRTPAPHTATVQHSPGLPGVYMGACVRADVRQQPPSKGSLRGSKCTPLCNSQLPACKPIVCRRSQVSKSYIDAEQRRQRSSVPDTCCTAPRARALSACMQ
jgi:hypothetical protein